MSARIYLLTMFLAVSGAAQAVEFDTNLKAPQATSALDLKTRLASVAARLSGPGTINSLDAIRDRSLARERFDARWMLGAMVDARVPLPELEELGFKPRGDGSYNVDSAGHPEWQSLTDNLVLLADPNLLTALEGTFTARGFRPEDFTALRGYVNTHNLKQARDERQLAVMISASRMAKKLEKLRRLDDRFMASVFFQKQLAYSETERLWAVGLLDALEPQAQRILASYFGEVKAAGFIAPTDTAAAYRHERETLLRPDFEQYATTAFKEGKL